MYGGMLGKPGKVNFPMFIWESSNVGLLNALQCWSKVSHILCYDFSVTPLRYKHGGLWKYQFLSPQGRLEKIPFKWAKLLTSTVFEPIVYENNNHFEIELFLWLVGSLNQFSFFSKGLVQVLICHDICPDQHLFTICCIQIQELL